MKFEELVKTHTTEYLIKVKLWINRHLQEGINPEVAINKLRKMDQQFNEKLQGLHNSFVDDPPDEEKEKID